MASLKCWSSGLEVSGPSHITPIKPRLVHFSYYLGLV